MSEPTRLHIVAVRYRNATPAPGDERGLDALCASGVYDTAGVPFDVFEPALVDGERSGDEVEDVGALCGVIAEDVSAALSSGSAVLMTGGNCVHALGVIGGLEDSLGASAHIGLVWLDAHADSNTPDTSPHGSLGGMPVAAAAGLALPEWRERARVVNPIPIDRILLVGCRDVDEAEGNLILQSGIRSVEIPSLEQEGRATAAESASSARGRVALARAVEALAERCDAIYLHIDIDVLDETFVPAHRSRTAGGPSVEEVWRAVDVVMSTKKVAAFAVVSTSTAGERGDVTLSSAVELIRGGLRSWRAHGMSRPSRSAT